jgi:D-sedoheptulose 7-phosphate isomerase
MRVKDRILGDLAEHRGVMDAVAGDEEVLGAIEEAAKAILASLRAGGRLYLFGCGGSAADAQHIAAEFVNRMHRDRAALPAIALTTDSSVLTAIGNDDSFDHVFSRQVEAFARQGDVVMGISTSGRSPSVLLALRAGRDRGAKAILLTGSRPESFDGTADLVLRVPSTSTPRIQEAHIAIAHIIATLVEEGYFHG